MLIIRKTKKEDLAKLSELYKRAYDRPKFGENWSTKDAKKLLNFYFALPTFIGITAVLDKEVVGGFFSFIKPWHDGNHLGEGELFVDPKYQNQKIGTKLFSEMTKIAINKKCVVHELVAYEGVAKWYA